MSKDMSENECHQLCLTMTQYLDEILENIENNLEEFKDPPSYGNSDKRMRYLNALSAQADMINNSSSKYFQRRSEIYRLFSTQFVNSDFHHFSGLAHFLILFIEKLQDAHYLNKFFVKVVLTSNSGIFGRLLEISERVTENYEKSFYIFGILDELLTPKVDNLKWYYWIIQDRQFEYLPENWANDFRKLLQNGHFILGFTGMFKISSELYLDTINTALMKIRLIFTPFDTYGFTTSNL